MPSEEKLAVLAKASKSALEDYTEEKVLKTVQDTFSGRRQDNFILFYILTTLIPMIVGVVVFVATFYYKKQYMPTLLFVLIFIVGYISFIFLPYHSNKINEYCKIRAIWYWIYSTIFAILSYLVFNNIYYFGTILLLSYFLDKCKMEVNQLLMGRGEKIGDFKNKKNLYIFLSSTYPNLDDVLELIFRPMIDYFSEINRWVEKRYIESIKENVVNSKGGIINLGNNLLLSTVFIDNNISLIVLREKGVTVSRDLECIDLQNKIKFYLENIFKFKDISNKTKNNITNDLLEIHNQLYDSYPKKNILRFRKKYVQKQIFWGILTSLLFSSGVIIFILNPEERINIITGVLLAVLGLVLPSLRKYIKI